jgi:Fur family peroxide stress response transcriptional regulator
MRANESRKEQILLFKKVCRENGMKGTPQRLEIFLEIMSAVDHPAAEEIYERVRVRLPTVSLDTVYRTLATLERCGLISRVRLLSDRARFDPNTSLHHHVVCRVCDSVRDFYWKDFDGTEIPQEIKGWGCIDVKHIQMIGTCAECTQKAPRK